MFDKELLRLPGVRALVSISAAVSVLRALLTILQIHALTTVLISLWEGISLSFLGGNIALFLGAFIARHLLQILHKNWVSRRVIALISEVRKELLQIVFSQGSSFVQQYGTAHVANLVREGMETLRTYLSLVVPRIIHVVIVPLFLLAYIFVQDWISGIIALVAFPFIVLFMVILGKTAHLEAEKQYDTYQQLSNNFIDSLRGLETLTLLGASSIQGSRIYAASERFRLATMKVLKIATLSSTILDLFSTAALAAVAIMLGLRLIDGSLAFAPALAVLMTVPEYFMPIKEFASDYHASLNGRTVLSLMGTIKQAALEPEQHKRVLPGDDVFVQEQFGSVLPAGNAPLRQAQYEQAQMACDDSPKQIWSASSKIECNQVCVTYPGETHEALSNISFSVTGYERVGLIGHSGCGKSTLAAILGGFMQPQSGEITLQYEVGNQQILEGTRTLFGNQNYLKQVIFIPQHPYIFHGTVAQNIAFYVPDASLVQIERAAQAVGLDHVINDLPQGYDTLIGEGARALSGGQAQRIALARAFLDPSRKILIFDEPTAHLDIETEYELKEPMRALMKDRLVIFATHRLHWMDDMDTVISLEGGRICANL